MASGRWRTVLANVFVVGTWESTFLADPSGAVWTPTVARNRGLPLPGDH